MSEQNQEIFRVAQRHFGPNADWVTFFREVLGVNGIVRRTHRTPESLTSFEQTPEYAEIQTMLTKLRAQGGGKKDEETEPMRVITVRLPKSMHEALQAEAHDFRTSMNKLCISKLLQVVDEQYIPTETTARKTKGSGDETPAVPAEHHVPVTAHV